MIGVGNEDKTILWVDEQEVARIPISNAFSNKISRWFPAIGQFGTYGGFFLKDMGSYSTIRTKFHSSNIQQEKWISTCQSFPLDNGYTIS